MTLPQTARTRESERNHNPPRRRTPDGSFRVFLTSAGRRTTSKILPQASVPRRDEPSASADHEHDLTSGPQPLGIDGASTRSVGGFQTPPVRTERTGHPEHRPEFAGSVLVLPAWVTIAAVRL